MKQYGKILVGMAPQESTNLLLDLCIGKSQNTSTGQFEQDVKVKRCRPENFIHNFVNKKKWLTEFLERFLAKDPACPNETVWNTIFELYLSPNDDSTDNIDQNVLEALRKRALDLLRNPQARYDTDHVLILCQLHRFLPGILYLYEKAERYQDIVRFHMDNNENRQVLKTCQKYGENNPNIWVDVLTFFTERPGDCTREITEVLDNISTKNLLSPLQVVEILSKNPSITLDLVKDFVLKKLSSDVVAIAEDEKAAALYQESISKYEAEIAELESR